MWKISFSVSVGRVTPQPREEARPVPEAQAEVVKQGSYKDGALMWKLAAMREGSHTVGDELEYYKGELTKAVKKLPRARRIAGQHMRDAVGRIATTVGDTVEQAPDQVLRYLGKN